jgi:hypothetical protein
MLYAVQGDPPMTTEIPGPGLRRATAGLFIAGALTFAAAATVLSSTFDWPDVLREPADVVLPSFVAGGTSLVWTWFATAWTYAILIVPILLLPAALGRPGDPTLRVATYAGATSVVLSLIGFLRWVFVVPPLADSYVTGDAVTRAAVDAAWTAQHQFGGALLGEHLGQLLAVVWSMTVSVVILRSGVLPRWLGVSGLAVSALYLSNQGDILATAVPGFPVWDLGGLIGSSGWGLWVAALGVVILLRPVPRVAPALEAGHQRGSMSDPEDAGDRVAVTELVESGPLAPVVDRTHRIDEAAAAIRRLPDAKAGGKPVVSVSPATTQTPAPGSTA